MNNNYLATLVDEFYQLGIRDVVVSPGSRSTSLAMLFEEYGKFSTYVDIDERSAGFFALGTAKASKKPVVLICTSGSAGAHYYPAVTEAWHSRVPLIILTADRPYDLQFVGAPQTMDQTRLFGDFVNHFENMIRPDEKLFWTYPRKVAQRAVLKGQSLPVQINVPLSEPLVPDLDPENFAKGRRSFSLSAGTMSTDWDFEQLPNKVLILAGATTESAQEDIIRFAEKLKAPVLADPLSKLRSFESPVLIDSYDAFLTDTALAEQLKPELIFQFGQIVVSKRVQQYIARLDCDYVQVDYESDYRNPSQTTTEIVQSHVKAFVSGCQLEREDSQYLSQWQAVQDKMRAKLDTVANEASPFEGRYVQLLQELMPAGSQLSSSNSMEIRDLDYFWKASQKQVDIYCNRGLSGIDGLTSTALGISANGKKTVMLTGDLSFFHDLTGLTVGKTEALNLTIILFNNDGGGIFHHLAQHDAKHFDRLFSTPHGLDFSGLAKLTGLDYHEIKDYEDFTEQFTEAITKKGIHLLEIKTDKEHSLNLHKKYTSYEQ
ncbi:2-succinyl-5-enolpyruvyl-6-hydroxy-3-cyclohexene-1-carboxylic-acid synthase [Lactococcus termiticola]|uniref:2-succinyl-5-enolpyruvyl-6-hydroxy-3-cyclohexene-1-carboxylate synthase n=1 Tax=Lactococcus termiticola TaxID=2169526 RepID=A0A2R5HJI2_9LACT|nr:2-succinyl-5-enolpyruvyl-6-hydroxy-3-cyclohexene-1-carboxylic-acid synthase [Lactococcus termiticola]GBG96421.1 2-succinyl-6-hydroxy-2, 4-cyclohexadiene-1-carboxylate synthase [Lactococcus termiticola]